MIIETKNTICCVLSVVEAQDIDSATEGQHNMWWCQNDIDRVFGDFQRMDLRFRTNRSSLFLCHSVGPSPQDRGCEAHLLNGGENPGTSSGGRSKEETGQRITHLEEVEV